MQPDYRFFRAENAPQMVENFRPILRLPEESLRKLNQWAQSNVDVILEGRVQDTSVHEAGDALGLPHQHFVIAMALIGTFLFGTRGSIDDTSTLIDAFIEELSRLGLGDDAAHSKMLLEGLNVAPERVTYAIQKQIVLQSVVPTLEDIDVLCDLRAVFATLPSPVDSPEYAKGIKTLLGLEPVVLVKLELNDAAGNDTVCDFQMTENELRELVKVLQDAATQLQVLKEKKP
jgi:hypothetical protein